MLSLASVTAAGSEVGVVGQATAIENSGLPIGDDGGLKAPVVVAHDRATSAAGADLFMIFSLPLPFISHLLLDSLASRRSAAVS